MTQIPDFFSTLTGWRKFDVAGNGRMLTSAGMTVHWWPTVDLGDAVCIVASDHEAPQLECTCGFYCYKERKDAEQHAQGSILAKVEIWGRIAEHTRGFRAQHMKILALFVSPSFAARSSLETRYHVPVNVDEGVSTWISENPYGSSSQNQWPRPSFNPQTSQSLNQYSPPSHLNAHTQQAMLLVQQYAAQQALAQQQYNQRFTAGLLGMQQSAFAPGQAYSYSTLPDSAPPPSPPSPPTVLDRLWAWCRTRNSKS